MKVACCYLLVSCAVLYGQTQCVNWLEFSGKTDEAIVKILEQEVARLAESADVKANARVEALQAQEKSARQTFEEFNQKPITPEAPPGMVLIPAGSFMMGSNDGDEDEKPVHEVYVDAFYMDTYEVTVIQFKKFIEATGYKTDAENEGTSTVQSSNSWTTMRGVNWRHDAEGKIIGQDRMNHSVIHVSWNDAKAYANWARKRLPTEAEWEYGARSGSKGYTYAWGNGSPSGKQGGNIADEAAKRRFNWSYTWQSYDDNYGLTAPVGSYEPNEFGLFDMTGNVYEWCEDWYGSEYYRTSPRYNPIGPSSGDFRVLRGGSWVNNPKNLRCTSRKRYLASYRNQCFGFRCAQDVR